MPTDDIPARAANLRTREQLPPRDKRHLAGAVAIDAPILIGPYSLRHRDKSATQSYGTAGVTGSLEVIAGSGPPAGILTRKAARELTRLGELVAQIRPGGA